MPKITIKEFDKTRAGSTVYANFSVALPGYVKPGIRIEATESKTGKDIFFGQYDDGTSIFDENGVFETGSQEDFEKYVGLVPSGEEAVIEAVAPTVNPNWNVTGDHAPMLLDEESFINNRDTGRLYIATPWEESGAGEVGYLKDENYYYTPVEVTAEWNADALYIDLVDRGSDAIRSGHFGNQIAYELLGLGYTILYKRMDSVSDLKLEDYWKALKDKAVYDFRYIITGLLTDDGSAAEQICKVATFDNTSNSTGRGDCIALIDASPELYEGKTQSEASDNIGAWASAATYASKYTAFFAPYVTYLMKAKEEFGYNRTFPGYFHYLACAARAAENFSEWYAVAGYTRGISKYTVESVGCKFGEAAIDALEPRNIKDDVSRSVNLIVKIKNNVLLWGNRTAALLNSADSDNPDLQASHFLNIRQLCSSIKKQIYVACRRFTFDPNSDVLWINFKNAIIPTLEKMKADQGITDYKFVKVATSQKAKLAAKIRIVPIEAVEDFDIDLLLEDSISGTVVGMDETEAE